MSEQVLRAPAADGEMDEAIKRIKEYDMIIVDGIGEQLWTDITVIIRAAQQPKTIEVDGMVVGPNMVRNWLDRLTELEAQHPQREEWRTMESANTAIDNHLVIERDILDHAQLSDRDKHYTLGCISGLVLAKELLKPLPSPPKAEK